MSHFAEWFISAWRGAGNLLDVFVFFVRAIADRHDDQDESRAIFQFINANTIKKKYAFPSQVIVGEWFHAN